MMIPLLTLLPMMAQASADTPRRPDPYLYCGCSADQREWDAEFTGIVTDADLRLAPDGRSTLPRQGTIFDVVRSDHPDIADSVKVWHLTDPKSCGVQFAYGRRSRVRVRAVADGWETDWCVDPRRSNRDESVEPAPDAPDAAPAEPE